MVGTLPRAIVESILETIPLELTILDENDLVGVDQLEDLRLVLRDSARYDARDSQLLEERGGEHRGLEVLADRHDRRVHLVDALRLQRIAVRRVKPHGDGDLVRHRLDQLLVHVDGDDLGAPFREFPRDGAPQEPESDDSILPHARPPRRGGIRSAPS